MLSSTQGIGTRSRQATIRRQAGGSSGHGGPSSGNPDVDSVCKSAVARGSARDTEVGTSVVPVCSPKFKHLSFGRERGAHRSQLSFSTAVSVPRQKIHSSNMRVFLGCFQVSIVIFFSAPWPPVSRFGRQTTYSSTYILRVVAYLLDCCSELATAVCPRERGAAGCGTFLTFIRTCVFLEPLKGAARRASREREREYDAPERSLDVRGGRLCTFSCSVSLEFIFIHTYDFSTTWVVAQHFLL